MGLLELLADFADAIDLIDGPERLLAHLEMICGLIGIRYFSLTHHVDLRRRPGFGVHLHNYPSHFAAFHDNHGLGARDPVHRASQLRGAGFFWDKLANLIALTAEDQDILQRAELAGIGPGYTVPLHVPGEISGSCSFAMSRGLRFPRATTPIMQALGAFAFEAARQLQAPRKAAPAALGHLTEREREIVVWIGHGKQEKQIARMLGISPSTVNDHLKHARARCGVHKSSLLVVCGLLAGSITYAELFDPRYPVSTG